MTTFAGRKTHCDIYIQRGPKERLRSELRLPQASDGDEACVVASVTGAAQELGVRKGDTLISVNDDDLRGHGFDRCVAFVKKAREKRGSSVLVFYRPRRRTSSSGVRL